MPSMFPFSLALRPSVVGFRAESLRGSQVVRTVPGQERQVFQRTAVTLMPRPCRPNPKNVRLLGALSLDQDRPVRVRSEVTHTRGVNDAALVTAGRPGPHEGAGVSSTRAEPP